MELWKKAFIKTIPVMAGYTVLGIGAGILAVSKGYGVLWVLCMSIFIYGGSMQYVGVDLMAAAVSPISVLIVSFMVQARHLFYGISMVDKLKEEKSLKKLYTIFAVTDETYALICQEDIHTKEYGFRYYFTIAFFNHLYWITGTVFGALLGNLLPLDTTGIDFAMTALFVSIFVEQVLDSNKQIYSFLGIGITLIARICFGSSSFLIPAMIGIIMMLGLLYKGKKNA